MYVGDNEERLEVIRLLGYIWQEMVGNTRLPGTRMCEPLWRGKSLKQWRTANDVWPGYSDCFFFFLSLSFLVDLLRTLQTPPRRSDKSEINKVAENVFQKKSRHDDDKIKSNKCTSSSSSPLLLQYMLQHIHAVVKELLNPHHYSLAHVSAIIKTFWTKHFLQSELQVI